jgi:hypothetical protein
MFVLGLIELSKFWCFWDHGAVYSVHHARLAVMLQPFEHCLGKHLVYK